MITQALRTLTLIFIGLSSTLYGQDTSPITVRVFIHGTILAGYFFLDIPASWSDSFGKNHVIERTVKSTRKDASLHYAELMLDEGLQDITEHVSGYTGPLYHDKAAIALVRAFHRMARTCAIDQGPVHYYTFGWSGGLSEKWRDIESELLYIHLTQLHDKLRAQYPNRKIKVELYAHSHGGQLVAHLATIHKKLRHPHLHIDLAVLCATPLYKEKLQPLASSSLFSMILNMHSYGDKVQNLDFISTPGHKCVRTCEELKIPLARGNCPGTIIADVCLAVHGCVSVFNHSNFFSFSLYRLPSYLKKRKHIRQAVNLFAPMPILALYPAIVHRIQDNLTQPGFHSLIVNLEQNDGILWVNSYKYLSESRARKLHPTRGYTIKPLEKGFIREYSRRARKTVMQHVKLTFYHLTHA